jgi:sulfur relay (sulfurtransferase) DsrC/TusE family protein
VIRRSLQEGIHQRAGYSGVQDMTDEKNVIKIFQDRKIRSVWNPEEEQWYFSIVDIIAVLTESANPNNYWKVLKSRLIKEGNQSVTTCNQLKMASPKDGKYYKTDVLNTKQLFRLVQSIPSPKAEPFKVWLAEVGYDRVLEIEDPERAQERMKDLYEQKGYSKDWIDKRLRGIAIRQNLTDVYCRRMFPRPNLVNNDAK